MTTAERTRLRHLIDQARRERINKIRLAHPRLHCTGCGIYIDDYSPGCSNCQDRRRRRARREREATPCPGGCGGTINHEDRRKHVRANPEGLCRKCLYASCPECGCHTDDRTDGCDSCHRRHYMRQWWASKRAQAA